MTQITKFRGGDCERICSELPGEFGTGWIEVHSENAAACGLQQLDGELPQQTETDDCNQVTELYLCGAYSVKSHRSDRCEGCLLERDFFTRARQILDGNARHQQPRNTCPFCVNGEAGASASYTVSRLQISDSIADGDDCSRTAVA